MGNLTVAESKYTALIALDALRKELLGLSISFATDARSQPVLQVAADNAKRNFGRVLEQASLPTYLFIKGYLLRVSESIRKDVVTKPLDEYPQVPADTPLGAIVNALRPFAAMWSASLLTNMLGDFDPAEISDVDAKEWKDVYASAERVFDTNYPGGALTLMSTLMTTTWTAFEVLAEELWDSAVRARPRTLLNSLAIKGYDNDGKPRKRVVPIEVETLAELDGDLRASLVDVLKSDGSTDLKFRSYDNIRRSYCKGFGDTARFSAFQVDKDRSLFELSQIRNAVVHKAGRADIEFIETMVNTQSARDEFKTLVEGDPIPLNGQVTSEVVVGATRASLRLIVDVDQWLAQMAK